MFSDLPYELLVDIVSFFVSDQQLYPEKPFGRANWESGDTIGAYSRTLLHNLSLVNKTFNRLCSKYTFAIYSLTFRSSDPQSLSKPPDSLFGLPQHVRARCRWAPEENSLHIAHMASKAQFIRELYIKDFGTGDIPVFPSSVLPELCEALKSLAQLEIVCLRCYGGPPQEMSMLLWDTLKALPIKAIDIRGLRPPLGATKWLDIHDVTFDWHLETAGFMDLFDPAKLTLRYNSSGLNEDLPPIFMPTSTTLRRLQVYYILPFGSWNHALFDLSAARHASVFMKFEMDYVAFDHYYVKDHIRDTLRHAFTDGLDRCESRWGPDLDFYIRRPALSFPTTDLGSSSPSIDVQPDFRPHIQAHLAETEWDEQDYTRLWYLFRGPRRMLHVQ